MLLTTCPRCREPFRMPAGRFAPDAQARCPWCREQFPLSEVLERLPPALEVLTPDGESTHAPVDGDQWDDPTFASGLELVDSDETEAYPPFGGESADEDSSEHSSSSLFVLDESTEGIDGEDFDPFSGDSSDRRGKASPAPMRVQPNTDISPRHKSRRPSTMRTVVGFALGPLIALPLAGAILVAVNRAPDLGFYPFDGSFGPQRARTAAPLDRSPGSGGSGSAHSQPQTWTPAETDDARSSVRPSNGPDTPSEPRQPHGRSLADGLDEGQRERDAEEAAADPAAEGALEQIAGDRLRELHSGNRNINADESVDDFDASQSDELGQSDVLDQFDKLDSSMELGPNLDLGPDLETGPDLELAPPAETAPTDPPSIVTPRTVIGLGDSQRRDVPRSESSPRDENETPTVNQARDETSAEMPDDTPDEPSSDTPDDEPNETPENRPSDIEADTPEAADDTPEKPRDTIEKQNDATDAANDTADPRSSPPPESREFRAAIEDAARQLDRLGNADGSDAAGRRAMALAYRAVARVASLARPEDRDELSALIDQVRDAGQLETFGRVAPEWFRVPAAKRGSDGILLVGEMRRGDDGWTIRASDDASIEVVSPGGDRLADSELEFPSGDEGVPGDDAANGSRSIVLGRIVGEGDSPAIELLLAEPL